jgi:hypothetical protein
MRPKAIRTRSLMAGCIVAPIASLVVACANASGGAYAINVDRNDPAAVIQGAVQTLFSWQPGADASPVDAFDRARPLMSTSLAAQQVALTTADAGSQWQQWAYDRTIITATAEILPDEHPVDTPTSVRRVVAVTQIVADPGPAPQDGVHFTLWVTAVKTPDGWRIDAIQA